DDNGNLLDDGTNAYEWDERNKLRRITRGATEIARFDYDDRGRRISKTVGSDITGFLYDGRNIVQELQGTGRTAQAKAHLNPGGLDKLFRRGKGNEGSGQNRVLSDANHNPIMLRDATQQKQVGYSYEPYGRTEADAVSDNRRQYAGRENDDLGIDG